MSFPVHPWKVVERGWQPNTQRFAESLMSLANGKIHTSAHFFRIRGVCSFLRTFGIFVFFVVFEGKKQNQCKKSP